MTNPLRSDWDTPFTLPPFAAIETAHFAPAFEAALEEARGEISAITANPAPPDFENTIEALEKAGHGLNKVLAPFYHLSGTDSTPEREALMRSFSPKLAAYSSDVMLDEALFARVQAVWDARDDLGVAPLPRQGGKLRELVHERRLDCGAC